MDAHYDFMAAGESIISIIYMYMLTIMLAIDLMEERSKEDIKQLVNLDKV